MIIRLSFSLAVIVSGHRRRRYSMTCVNYLGGDSWLSNEKSLKDFGAQHLYASHAPSSLPTLFAKRSLSLRV